MFLADIGYIRFSVLIRYFLLGKYDKMRLKQWVSIGVHKCIILKHVLCDSFYIKSSQIKFPLW